MIGDIKSRDLGKRASIGILLLASLFLNGCGEQRFEPLEAQDFSLPSLEGDKNFALNNTRGDVVYLTFWASWCIPCQQEMPYLEQLWQRHEDAGLKVIGVNSEEDIEAARTFAAQHKITFPLVHDAGRAVSQLYRVPGYPTHYIVDRRGKIRFSGLGFNLADAAAISQEIETLLAETLDKEPESSGATY
jgi:peroxiredoxin